MYNKILLAGVAAVVSGIASAHADDKASNRLVITYSGADSSQMRSASVTPSESFTEIVEVPEGQSSDTIAAEIRRIPGVRAVERDYITSIPTSTQQIPFQQMASGATLGNFDLLPNDPDAINQNHWKTETEIWPGQSDYQAAFNQYRPARSVNVAVIDGGFDSRSDLNWDGGYNLNTFMDTRGPEYKVFDIDNCSMYHGQAVGAIIGANTNNGSEIAGMVDAGMYAIRVLGCGGSGYMSDAADAIRYAAGSTSITGSHIGADIDVINLSMGSKTNYCPTYLQEAIDYATEKGITVVVAAGNDSYDVSGQTPANCQNVITVGAVDRDGSQASYTNYGEGIDISALGTMVLSQGAYQPTSYWVGTSFATPIVSGMVAHLKQLEYPLSSGQITNLLMSSATSLGETTNPLGVGVMNARRAVEQYQNMVEEIPTLTSVLNTGDRCDSSIYDDYHSASFSACGLVEFYGNKLEKDESEFYVLYQVDKGSSFTKANGQIIKASQENKFITKTVDVEAFDFGTAICNDPEGLACRTISLTHIDVSGANSPVSCLAKE